MEPTEPKQVPHAAAGLFIPAEAKSYFRNMARWCRLVGIGGILVCVVLGAILSGILYILQFENTGPWRNRVGMMVAGYGILFIFLLLLTIFILRFSNGMFRAARFDQMRDTRNGFVNLLTFLRLAGILSMLILFGQLLLATALFLS